MQNTTETVTLSIKNVREYPVLMAEIIFPPGETVEVTVQGHYLVQLLACQDLEAMQTEAAE
jgi:hypothetical protein